MKLFSIKDSNKLPSGRLGRPVDSLSGQVPLHSHLPDGQGIGQAVFQRNH